MEFSTLDIMNEMPCHCIVCKKEFMPINDEAEDEFRCRDCQLAWRIENANNANRRNSWNDWRSRQSLATLIRLKMVNVYM